MHRPSLPMVETFCVGCRLGMYRGTLNFAKKNKIPVIIRGGTPFEQPYYRQNLMKIPPDGGNYSRILGYLYQIVKNPRYIMKRAYLVTQIKEYLHFFHSAKLEKISGILGSSPFWTYIKWDEKEVISTITNELNWRSNPNVKSTWRGDCDIALLKLYVYKKVLGFNDKIDNLSHLIRDGQLI